MCGRYTLARNTKEILEHFGLAQIEIEFEPRFNIAPSQMVPIIIEEKLDGEDRTRRVLTDCKWGLLPGFVKDTRLLKPMINARGETIIEKRLFKNAFLNRRCLIPADGFYEWISENKKKFPVRFQINKGELFAFAGIYEEGKNAQGEVERTCAIITTAANDKVMPVHHRMPVILKREAEDFWLRKSTADRPERLLSLLGPCDNDAIDFYRCSTAVNNVRKDSPDCILRAESMPEKGEDFVQLKLL